MDINAHSRKGLQHESPQNEPDVRSPCRACRNMGTGGRALRRLAAGGVERLQSGLQVVVGMDRGDEAADTRQDVDAFAERSEEHTSELQSLMRISYAVFCLKTKKTRMTYTY